MAIVRIHTAMLFRVLVAGEFPLYAFLLSLTSLHMYRGCHNRLQFAAMAHLDSMREVRAMIIASLPCPPLPIMCTKPTDCDDETSDGNYYRCKSHDLLAHLMNLHASNDNEDAVRMDKQNRVVAELIAKMDAYVSLGRTPTADEAYEHFCDFFRAYLATYMGPKCVEVPDVRCYPLDSVLDTDSVTVSARDHCKVKDLATQAIFELSPML